MRRLPAVLLLLLAVVVALGAPAQASPGHAPQAGDVLPDLDQMVPTDLGAVIVRRDGRRKVRLGFSSAAANVGAGPLTLHGVRPTRRMMTMNVAQLVDQRASAPRLVRDVGKMSYVVHPDHRHWHFLGFESYELRRPGSDLPSAHRDRKTGFCLGDREVIRDADELPGHSPAPLQGDTCGLGRPDLLGLFAGISTGYADRYAAQIEGQFIDITFAPARQYVLVHTVNPDKRILESDYSNNASSVRFRLSWPNGFERLPRIKVLRTCPKSAACP